MWVRSLGREDPLEEGMATPLQYACLENPMVRGAWWTTVPWGCKEWGMTVTNLATYSTRRAAFGTSEDHDVDHPI